MSLLVFQLFFVLLGVSQVAQAVDFNLSINTTIGTVRGFINGSTPDVAQFLGIPFAEPPVGQLRWARPQAKTRVKSIVDATHLPPSCPQYESKIPSVYNQDVRQFFITGVMSEDCLAVSIWTPLGATTSKNASGLPVFAWIYGGGFTTGGADVPYQQPEQWIQRSQFHIVVAINYRVNIFGFPNARGLNETSQNLGLLDQRLAVEWIRDNIAAFGGDASRITLWGQSAGAMSVGYYDFAYPDDPIINSLVMDSGSALLPSENTDTTHSNFTFVASEVGCSGSLSAAAELACMRNVSYEVIEEFLLGYVDNETSPSISFGPVDDEVTKFSNFTSRALGGHFTKKPAIIGTNADEGTSLVTYDVSGPNLTLVDIETDSVFLCPSVKTTSNRYAVGATTFRYWYNGNFSNISPRAWQGAYHSSELPLIFGTHGNYRGASTPYEVAVSQHMQDLWLAFASDPIDGLPNLGWEAYKPDGMAMALAYDGQISRNLSIEIVDSPCT
ncbi:MAG: hypothetical protein M1834_000077 [Cirrosporium novae-zelandiae]|nr:MAG: hypothetical protein M1834_000077 [Cirrosporium novae-zelandiae]